MIRVILELKSALEKGTTIKDVTGGATSTSSAPQMGGFGIGGFISSGGIVGKEQTIPAPPALEVGCVTFINDYIIQDL
jgi:hypothetical protein